MKIPDDLFSLKLVQIFSTGLSFITLALVIWSGWLLVHQPHLGADWSYTSGLIENVYSQSPAFGVLTKGDRILKIDGVPVYEARNLPGKHVGDTVYLTIDRHGQIFDLGLKMERPSFAILVSQLEILFVALLFSLLGIMVSFLGTSGKTEMLLVFYCQVLSAILSLGSISGFAPILTVWVYRMLLILGGPVAVHTHLYFPASQRMTRPRINVVYLYGPGLLMILAGFILGFWDTWFFRSLTYLWLGVNLFLLAGVVLLTYRCYKSQGFRAKVIYIVIATLLGFLPVLLFTVLPEAILAQSILPYHLTLLFLAMVPVGYGYAILRHRLLKLERSINRGTAYSFAAILIATLDGFVFLKLPFIQSIGFPLQPAWVILNFLLILAAYPLYRVLQRVLSKLLYGGWYDDRVAAQQISRALYQTGGSVRDIAWTLCQTMKRSMQLEYVNLMMKDGDFISSNVHPEDIRHIDSAPFILDDVQAKLGKEIGEVKDLPVDLFSNHKERPLVLGRRPQLWMLIYSNLKPSGLIVLGFQKGNEYLAPDDLDTLGLILHQAGVAIENAYLLDEIRQRSNLIRALNQRILHAREEERKRLSRDLHDQVIQSLIGVSFQLVELGSRSSDKTSGELASMRGTLRQSLNLLRQICGELRPPALDVLGLPKAIEAKLIELQQHQGSPYLKFKMTGNADQEIPEAASVCVYRVFQEAIQNVLRHAQAAEAEVCLQIDSGKVWLTIRDDGKGFVLPRSLEEFAKNQHFGLVGLQERIAAVQGRFDIQTAPGQGCSVSVEVPCGDGNHTRISTEINEKQSTEMGDIL